jgi:hypothetical protein
MAPPDDVSIPSQRRKHPRFQLNYPVQLKVAGEGGFQELEAMSDNISLGGLLVQAARPVPQNCAVEFVMTVQRSGMSRPIRLKSSGRVVRVEEHSAGIGFGIAIECKRPITRIRLLARQ